MWTCMGRVWVASFYDPSMDWSCISNYFLSFSFGPIRGKETDKCLTVEAIVANSCSTVLIFFFKSSIREFEDKKVWVTTSTIFCWLSRTSKGLGFVPQHFLPTNLKLLQPKKPISLFHLDWFQQDFWFSKFVLCWFGDVQNFQVKGKFCK